MIQKRAVFLAVLLLLAMSGCREVPTSVRVRSGPSFTLKGSGRLAIFTVYAPQGGQKVAFPDPAVASVVWTIRAKEGYFKGARANDLQLIYGRVPEGYEQVVPERSQPAPALPPGEVYSFFAETTDAPIASGYFYTDRSGIVQTKVPDLCLAMVQGQKTRVKCGLNTNQPYQEPTDLQAFVKKNEVAE